MPNRKASASYNKALVYSTAVLYKGVGIAFMGPSGSGKSDIALRLLSRGAQLVSDDQVEFSVSSNRVLMSAPKAIEKKIEVRGLGIESVITSQSSLVPLNVVLSLKSFKNIERLPETAFYKYAGISLPKYDFDPFELSWSEKLDIILSKLSS